MENNGTKRDLENHPRVSDRELKALKALAEFYCSDGMGYISFDTVARNSGLPREQVRRTVRALARKGLAAYGSGLWSDEGYPRGSGYCCTRAGSDLVSHLPALLVQS